MAFGKWPYLVQDYFTKGIAGMECKDWINEQHLNVLRQGFITYLGQLKKAQNTKINQSIEKRLSIS
jgi:hypothetical protein